MPGIPLIVLAVAILASWSAITPGEGMSLTPAMLLSVVVAVLYLRREVTHTGARGIAGGTYGRIAGDTAHAIDGSPMRAQPR
ncbi:hypothetical protein [Sphingomonas liriopis]|uniref:hypothetical protein n=1 Tax=Sphingomonas liriopis TaxID=2949094 RepID=UPI003BF4C7B1